MLAARYVPSSLPSLVIPGGEAQGRVYLTRERCHKAALTLIRRCYSHIRAPDWPHGRGVLRRRCAQPSAPSRGTLQYRSRALPKAARAPAWHADGPCPMFLGPVLVLSRRQSHNHTPQNMPFVASHDSPRDSAYKYHITLWRAPQPPIAPGILRSTFGHNLSVSGSRVPVAALFLTNPSRPTKLDSLYLDLPPESSQFSLTRPTHLGRNQGTSLSIQANAVTAADHEPALSSVKPRSTTPVLPRPGIRLRRLMEAG